METYVVIPEEVVKQAANDCRDNEQNGFLKVLIAGNEYKKAGLTPIYILDQNFMDLVVVAKETFQKKLH
jgi:hypothetical protein